MAAAPTTILTLSCPNRPGIVAAVAGEIFAHAGNIAAAHQFDDPETGRFFMRVVVEGAAHEALAAGMAPVASRFGMDWAMYDAHRPRRVLLLASAFDHCLADLLYRRRMGELRFEVAGIVANRPAESYAHLNLGEHRFHYLPVTPDTKLYQEAALWRIVEESGAELVVLARYMQILSDDLSTRLAGRCINIHHSFLPSFKGARPYHQAHARGVKVIGATAHYVTPALDEGPIIAQDVEAVSHADTPDMLIAKGRDIERRVLARAVAAHLDGRVLVNGGKTVVFAD